MVNQAPVVSSAHTIAWLSACSGKASVRVESDKRPPEGLTPDVSTFRGSGPKAEAAFNNWCPVAGEFIDATVRFLQQGPQATVQ